MKKIISFFLITCILSGFIITAEAVGISFQAEMDASSMELLISGRCDTKRNLTFYVTDDGVLASEITFENNIYAMEQIISDEDGSFSFRIKMPDDLPEGDYKVIAGGVGKTDENDRNAVFKYRDLGNFSLWLEAEEASLSGNYRVVNADESSGAKRIAADTSDVSVNNRAVFDFSVPAGATYDIWVLSTPGNVTYTSKYLYDIDSEDPKINNNSFIEQVYTTHDIRQVGIGWSKLDEKYLGEGEHTLTFACDTKRELENDFIYHVLDTVVIVPKNWDWTPNGFGKPYNIDKIKINYKSALLSGEVLSRGDTLEAVIQASAAEKLPADVGIWAALMKDGEFAASAVTFPETKTSEWTVGKNYLTTIEINVPTFAPDAEYEVVAGVGTVGQSGFYNIGDYARIGSATVGDIEVLNPEEAVISNVELTLVPEGIKASFTLSEANFHGFKKPFLKLWKDDVLWGVAEAGGLVETGETPVSLESILFLPEGIPPGIYSAEFGLYNVNGTYKCEDIELIKSGDYGYKPLSNGVYKSGKTGREHVWYVNQENALIWDGEPYIPMGGMECLSLITNYSNNQNSNEALWEADKAELDLLARKGVRDLYINAVGSSKNVPDWVWEYVMDYMDKKGFRYSIQTNAGENKETELYYIRSNPEKSPIVLEGVSKSGVVTKETSLSDMESYGQIEPVSGIYALVNSEGNTEDAGACSFEKTDTGYCFTADITLPSDGVYSVYFTPKVKKSISIMTNFWDYGDDTLAYAHKFSRIPAGDGLRSIIDPLDNESGYYNGVESIRPCSRAHNDMYRDYLAELYKTIENLNKAWGAFPAIPDFDAASRIIPVHTGNNGEEYAVCAFDEKSGLEYTLDGRRGVMWNDYLDFRDGATAEFYNETADAYKEGLDVPVIVKNVWGHKEYFKNERLSGGLDGLGTEAYGNYSRIANLQTSTYGMANQYAKTAWLIVTETSTEEDIQKKYESGQFGYESEAYMHGHFDTLMEYGAKGIFDFLLSARHNEMTHVTYSYVKNPEQFEWMNNYINKLDENAAAKYVPDKKMVYLMPHNSNFYTSPNRYTSVLYGDSYKALDQACVQSGIMLMLTEEADISAKILAANFENGPASYYQGKKFSEEIQNMPPEKKAIYLGQRNDLGAVPAIDKYFTNEFTYNADGVKVQVLNPPESAQILMTAPDGSPWAIRDGNLWIVSAQDCILPGEVKYLEETGIFEEGTGLTLVKGSFETEDGCEAGTLESGKYILNTEIRNDTGADTYIKTVLALYDADGRLSKVEYEENAAVPGLNTVRSEITAEEKDFLLKGFIWDVEMKPLGIEISLERMGKDERWE